MSEKSSESEAQFKERIKESRLWKSAEEIILRKSLNLFKRIARKYDMEGKAFDPAEFVPLRMGTKGGFSLERYQNELSFNLLKESGLLEPTIVGEQQKYKVYIPSNAGLQLYRQYIKK